MSIKNAWLLLFAGVVLVPVVSLSGTLSWAGGPIGLGDSHVILGTTVVQLYRDNGDNAFTWGGEGAVLDYSDILDFGDPAGYYFGESYNYGTSQGSINFWAVYYDPTGPGYYAVSSDGIHNVPDDPIGNALPSWDVQGPGEWVMVPEPSTLALFALGLLAVAVRKFRR